MLLLLKVLLCITLLSMGFSCSGHDEDPSKIYSAIEESNNVDRLSGEAQGDNVDHLIKEYLVALSSQDDSQRSRISGKISRIGEPAVQPILQTIDSSDNINHRLHLLDLVHLLGSQKALPELHRLLENDESIKVREKIPQILSQMGNRDSIPILKSSSLEDPSSSVRSSSLSAYTILKNRFQIEKKSNVSIDIADTVLPGEPLDVELTLMSSEPAHKASVGVVVPDGISHEDRFPAWRGSLDAANPTRIRFNFLVENAPKGPLVFKVVVRWDKRDSETTRIGVLFRPIRERSGRLLVKVLREDMVEHDSDTGRGDHD